MTTNIADMNMNRLFKLSLLAATCGLTATQGSLQAGTFSSDFNSSLPNGCAVFGYATNLSSGGYTNSGFVQLTPDQQPASGQTIDGSFVITNDLDAGSSVVSFTASFKVLIGGGARFGYGEGMSFNFGPNVPLGTTAFAEAGVGNGLQIGMRTTKDASAVNPAISVSGPYGATEGSPRYVNNLRANTFVDMVVQLNPNNTVSVIYDGVYIYSNATLNYVPDPGSLFWIGGSCRNAHENHLIDNLKIDTRTTFAPFISSFGPQGRQVQAGSSLDIVLHDYVSNVDTNMVALSLDGKTVSPTITQAMNQDGYPDTILHFAPGTPFAPSSQHSVSLTFADNTTPTAQSQTFSWSFTVAEAIPTNFVTVWKDNLESYKLGYLDKNISGDPNYAANGAGNPWFGPWPENYNLVDSSTLSVDGTNVNVTPHSGTKMMTTGFPGQYNVQLWVDLAYRFHGGYPIKGNAKLDWWFYDANNQDLSSSTNGDYVSLYFYGNDAQPYSYPFTADWPSFMTDPTGGLFYDNGFGWNDDEYQSLSLGGSGYNQKGGYWDNTKYQVRLEEMFSGVTYGIDGWVNTADRAPGWHHGCILMGPPRTNGTVMVYFYIDDMTHPVYAGLSGIAAKGINLLEVDSLNKNQAPAAYDDFSLALVQPPSLVANSGSGNSTTITWSGEGFTLQGAATVNGPWTDIAGATSPYSYDTTSSPMQFFRLRN